jgi:hypothetical protein
MTTLQHFARAIGKITFAILRAGPAIEALQTVLIISLIVIALALGHVR